MSEGGKARASPSASSPEVFHRSVSRWNSRKPSRVAASSPASGGSVRSGELMGATIAGPSGPGRRAQPGSGVDLGRSWARCDGPQARVGPRERGGQDARAEQVRADDDLGEAREVLDVADHALGE